MEEKTFSLLADFCGVTKQLNKPFCDGKYTYASDGKVIVRFPGGEITEILVCSPGISKLRFEQSGELVPLPELPKETKAICDICGGQGKVTICPECDGDGNIYYSTNNHEYEWNCKECDSAGYIPGDEEVCPECKGIGKVITNFKKSININGHKLQLGYLRKLSKLPGIKIVAHPVEYQHYFKFDGGDGILMGMR